MLSRRVLAAALSVIAPAIAQAASPAKPNIIYIMADDLGYADVGCYGQAKIRTPNVDRLAAEGIRFTNMYAGAPCCAPSRCVLLTGKHLGHARVRDNSTPELQKLAAEDLTIANLLQDQGYETACIGKWGLGSFADSGNPLQKGFGHFFGYLNQTEAHRQYPAELDRDGERITIAGNANGARGTYAHDLFTADALTFIDKPHTKPFFLYLSYTMPHAELLVPDDSLREYAGMWAEKPFKTKYFAGQDQPRAARAAMVTRMDRDIGALMAKLKQLNLEDDTLVIFTSDNGPAPAGGSDPAFFNSTGDLTGLKFTLAEGGIRVPFIVRWPGRITPGATTDMISSFADIFPTFSELAGIEQPTGLDGISILPTLTGRPAAQKQHEYLYWEFQGAQALRMADFKAWRNSPREAIALYDLKTDPGERVDVAAAHPDLVRKADALMAEAHVDEPNFPMHKPAGQ